MIVCRINYLTESAITDNNFRRMDGVTAKKYMIRGATRDQGIDYPNDIWGYGKLSIYGVFDTLRNR